MSAPHFAVVWSTVALASALPRSPQGTPREQQVFEYFPDFRYVDPMENPSFMTAKCTSEGVFPHPHNCTWFYRCHDRTGHGFFTTNWFYCEPGTEFDDDLDQCIPKSGTCGDGEDTNFCRNLPSSCRSCNVGSSQQQLCEFKECFNGGRDAGIQRICKQGQLFDGQSCVEVSGCPSVASPPGECPLNMMRPAAKWTDEASGCSVYSGCRAGRNYQETLCSSFYDCQQGTKVLRSCPDGYFFSPQWELCIKPPQTQGDCTPLPPPPPRCILSQGVGQECQEYTGCFIGNPVRSTKRLCNYYICTSTGSQKYDCGSSKSFSPDTNTCLSNPVECPVQCLPENAVRWESCNIETGYRSPSAQQISELLCQEYSCSQTNGLQPCGPGQLFEPNSKTCLPELTPILPPPCSANQATLWESCTTVSGCSDDVIQRTREECQIFKCSANGEAFSCQSSQVFSPTIFACVNPYSVGNCQAAQCTADQAQFWGDCKDVTGCTADNQSEQTENQCQTYQCSITGQEFRCEGGQVFSPDQRSCVEPINAASCPCTVDRAKFWGDCKDVTGCTADNQSEQTVNQCQTYQCSITGQEFRCEGGLVFSPDQRSCVEPLNAASCPCTVDRARFWGDCKDVTGCTADNQSEQTVNQCQTYQCSITGQEFRCEGGLVFSPDQRSCVEPLNDASCPCTIDRAQSGRNCKTVTGCTPNNQTERTEEQCEHFQCSNTGQEISCEGGQVFSPEQRSCVEPLNPDDCPTTPEICTPAQAKKWTTCQDFCDNDLGSKTEMCYFFSCSETADWKKPHKISCNDQFTELFDPTTKTCTPKRNECPRAASSEFREGCSPNRAILWYDCSTNNACIDDRYPQQQQSLCGQYSCEGEKITCSDGQMYDSEKSVCVTPLTGKYCLDGDRPNQPKVAVKSWNNQWN